jgi:hypothetical protein
MQRTRCRRMTKFQTQGSTTVAALTRQLPITRVSDGHCTPALLPPPACLYACSSLACCCPAIGAGINLHCRGTKFQTQGSTTVAALTRRLPINRVSGGCRLTLAHSCCPAFFLLNTRNLIATIAALWLRLLCSLRRTARGRSGQGRALLMLLPEELSFLKYLKVGGWVGAFPLALPCLLARDCLLSAWPYLPNLAWPGCAPVCSAASSSS